MQKDLFGSNIVMCMESHSKTIYNTELVLRKSHSAHKTSIEQVIKMVGSNLICKLELNNAITNRIAQPNREDKIIIFVCSTCLHCSEFVEWNSKKQNQINFPSQLTLRSLKNTVFRAQSTCENRFWSNTLHISSNRSTSHWLYDWLCSNWYNCDCHSLSSTDCTNSRIIGDTLGKFKLFQFFQSFNWVAGEFSYNFSSHNCASLNLDFDSAIYVSWTILNDLVTLLMGSVKFSIWQSILT